MKSIVSQAGKKVLEQLIGFPPRTIPELMAALHVTRTAITEQLHELTALGFVERFALPRASRGRPQYRYRATPEAIEKLCQGNEHLLVPAIWNAIREIGGETLLEKVVDEIATQLAEKHGGKEPDWHSRLQALVFQGGFDDCQYQEDGSVLLTKRTCRLHAMRDEAAVVCQIHLQTLAKITHARIERVAYRLEDSPCCQFRVVWEELPPS